MDSLSLTKKGVWEDSGRVDAHLRRNCKESKEALRVIASGFSATESTIGFNTVFMSALVRFSGSLSQSTREESASGVEMEEGSLM